MSGLQRDRHIETLPARSTLPTRCMKDINASRPCSVYIMARPGQKELKIGLSVHPHDRARQLNAQLLYAEWLPSELLASLAEKAAHGALIQHWYDGEWFRCGYDEALDAVRDAAARARINPFARPGMLNVDDEAVPSPHMTAEPEPRAPVTQTAEQPPEGKLRAVLGRLLAPLLQTETAEPELEPDSPSPG